MSIKQLLLSQGLIPKKTEAYDMQIFGFFSLCFLLAAIIYFT